MTQARATPRRTRLEKNRAAVVAALIEGKTHGEIARLWKVEVSSVSRFQKRHIAEIDAGRVQVERAVTDAVIADKVRRILAADMEHTRLGQVIEARAADTRYDEPGYSSGMMVHKLRMIGTGPASTVVDEYEVDTATVTARAQLRRDVAHELDQLPRAGAGTSVGIQILIREVNGIDPGRLG